MEISKVAACIVLSLLWFTAQASDEPPLHVERQVAVKVGDDPAWAEPSYDDATWERSRWWDITVQDEIVWLRQTIQLPPVYTNAKHPPALFLTAAAASEVWWDGQLIGKNGVVGGSPSAEVPGQYITMFPLPPNAGAGEHFLAIRYSSQHTRSRIKTPIDELYFGPLRDPLQLHQSHYLPSLVLGGALTFATLFLLGMCFQTRSASTLLLALAGIAFLAQLAFETSRGFVLYTYDFHLVRATGIAISAWFAGLALLTYLSVRFRVAKLWRWLVVSGGIGIVAAILARYPDPATIAALFPFLAASLVVSIRARLANKAGATVITVGLVLILALLFLDPSQFLDISLYIGFSALLLGFFVDHLRSYVRAHREREQAALLSQRLKHELLKRSVQPHFLMNTLTTMAEWVEQSPEQGVEMIHALAKELRLLGQFAELDLVTLDEEIRLCQAHLKVMGFRQDLDFQLVVQGPTDRVYLPPAVLHTLVENALSHNRYDSGAMFHLTITQSKEQVQLCFECPPGTDDPHKSAGQGTGFAYIQARLRESFGDDGTLASSATSEGGWSNQLSIPVMDEVPVRQPQATFTTQLDT